MPTQAVSAYGIQLKLATVIIPELVSLSDFGGQAMLADVSAHDGNGWSARIPTLLDGGTIRAVFNFVPANAQHIAMRTAFLNRTSVAMSIVLPTSGNPTWTFNAFITNYRVPNAPVNAQLPLNVDITTDGVVTFA
jgi:hypothetical protein